MSEISTKEKNGIVAAINAYFSTIETSKMDLCEFINEQPIPCIVSLIGEIQSRLGNKCLDVTIKMLIESNRMTWSARQVIKTAYNAGVRGIALTSIIGHLECLKDT